MEDLSVKKRFIQEVINNNGELKHDYTNDLHFSYIMELLGGKQNLKANHPSIYKSLCYTRKLAKKNKLNKLIKQEDDTQDDLHDATNRIEYIAYEPNVDIQSSMLGSYSEQKPSIVIIGEIVDVTEDKVLDCFSYEACNEYSLEGVTSCKDEGVTHFEERIFRSEATFIWTDIEKNNLRMSSQTLISEEKKMAGAASIIKNISVEDPMPKSTQRTNVVVVYNREAQAKEGFDYSYPNVMKDNKVKVNLPFKGKVQFKETWIPKGVDINRRFKIQLELEDEGIVEYLTPINPNFFTIKDNQLSWDFSNDWGSMLNTTHFNASTIANFYCSMYINLENKVAGINTAVPIIIKSGKGQDTSKDTSVKIISQIKIQWGCFGKNTMVMMSDGTYRNIEEIKIGDTVTTKDLESSIVKNIFIGNEAELVRIITETKKCLEVTKTHPICTANGIKIASQLKASDIIKTSDGLEKISSIYMIDYDDVVYNLDVEESALLICNGIYAGDYQMQNNKVQNKDRYYTKAKEVTEFQKEIHDICENLRKKGGR